MKTFATILVMLCMMFDGYTQTSRREANTNRNERGARAGQNTDNRGTSRREAVQRDNKTTRTPNRSGTPTRSTNREATTPAQQRSTKSRSESREKTRSSTRSSTRQRPENTSRSSKTTRSSNVQTHRSSPAVVNKNSNNRRIESSRQFRGTRTAHHHVHNPRPKSYRSVHYAYKVPTRYSHVVWSRSVHYDFCRWYPEIRFTWYPVGHRVSKVSAYHADYHIGELASVYGRVKEVFYSRETDEYVLYFGEYYPYHDFSLVVPGRIARRYSSRPAYYLRNRNIVTTGLITVYDDKPEIVVKHSDQIKFYH